MWIFLFAVSYPLSAHAQSETTSVDRTNTASSAASSDSPSNEETGGRARLTDIDLFPEEITITGSAQGTKKLESTYAVSTLGEQTLETIKPLNTVDLLTQVPGFWAESSGGEGGNNVFARGIPAAGSFRYVALYEDGLPLYEEPETAFLNGDILSRLDLTVARVEAVRGGTSPIFANNAAGGTINIITKKGTETHEGIGSLTWGDYGMLRFDGHASGPITDHVLFSIGGFYRGDDGIRETGFRANSGGQLRASLTYKFDDGDLTVYGKYLNDRTTFYLPIPLRDPRDPTVSLSNLINPNTGTLASNELRRARLRTLDGSADGTVLNADLGDGMHPDVLTAGVQLDYSFDDGWRVQNHSRIVIGDVGFNAIFSLNDPSDAAGLLSEQLARAQDPVSGFGDAVERVEYRYANGGGSFDPSTTGGLVIRTGWWSQQMAIQNFINDLRISKELDLGDAGIADVTLGFYFSEYRLETRWHFNTVLTELRDQPRLLDVVAFGANDTEIGRVTENGFLSYGDFGVNAAVDATTAAGYISSNWSPNDRLRIEVGARYQFTTYSGSVANRTNQDLGNPATLADDNVGGPDGTNTQNNLDFGGIAASAGANYALTSKLGVFGRFTRAYRIPRTEVAYGIANEDTEGILQAELGVKLALRQLSVFIVGYWSRFDSLFVSDTVIDPDTGDIVALNIQGESQTFGAEIEAVWRPFRGLSLALVSTIQNPTIQSLSDANTGEDFSEFDGNRLRRLPSLQVAFRPAYSFFVGDLGFQLYGNLQHQGNRFVDFANNTELPAYQTIDAGIITTVNDAISLQVHGSNLTNSTGITEGNPRVGTIAGQASSEVLFGRPILGRAFRASLTYRY